MSEKKKGIIVVTKTEAHKKKGLLKKLGVEYDIVILSKKKYDEYLKQLDQEYEELSLEETENERISE